ncbi:hypothetical protein Bb109J_c1951 [Bdellovibrio bacteriovorus]|uniref:hypothetical protein n=1 Tax=Bdellovibrio bacteriovorus TaxID=959 RepID=UPI00045BF9FF|nr:hypothetical protein [Bdellovibrio bacteriovorus]AHZ84641.1 hypothetical protein EP01_06780 [Bdellovibrio bacteriovorus]BEV68531.1 hypothetical protein Bb109J_c1951 [Bdellovibrio bacteriovorus]
MSLFRAFIAPISENGQSHEPWVEVTDDVDFESMGNIQQRIEGSDYDVGVFTFSQFVVTLRNDHGLYSDGTMQRSIFFGKRSESLFRLIWQKQDFPSVAGSIMAGQFISGNTEFPVFEGILKDEAAQMNISDQKVNFMVLGKEAALSREIVPFGEISAGVSHKDLIFKCLNQPFITKYFSVDLANINPMLNLQIDVVDDFENKTVDEAMKLLLRSSNSVLFVKDGAVVVRGRDASPEVKFQFFGQASNKGVENVIDIRDVRTGIHRTFNFWTWADTEVVASDISSVAEFGIIKKKEEFKYITNATKQSTILSVLKEEFKNPKMEFKVLTPITTDSILLFLLDRVKVDYPTVYFTEPGENIPIYGIARYGEARYPFGEFSLQISPLEEFKILNRSVNVKDQYIELTLRGV